MTIALLVDNPAGSRELYERVLDNLGQDLPLGGILHIAGPPPKVDGASSRSGSRPRRPSAS